MRSILPTIKWTLVSVLFLLQFKTSQATHVDGYEVYYECLNPCTVRVYKKEYMSCNNWTLGSVTIANFSVSGTNCSPQPLGMGWDTLTNGFITPVCPSISPCSTFPELIEKIAWRDFDHCATSCPQFTIGQVVFGRSNTNNLNLTTGSDYNFYVYPLSVDASLGCNSSPYFVSAPKFSFCDGFGVMENPAFDPDGDSLVYSMVPVLDYFGVPVTYQTGFSVANPWGAGWNLNMNAQTGDIVVTGSGNFGVYSMGVLVEEYRNGIKIGQIFREQIVSVGNCPNLNSPTLSEDSLSPVATQVSPNHFQIQEGQEFSFDIKGLDLADSLFLEWGNEITGATFTEVGGSQMDSIYGVDSARGRFSWTPMNAGWYYFTVVAQDFNCPVSAQALRSYTIEVTPGDSVWPGDANNDNIANNFDVLALGLAGGFTGPSRVNPTSAWIGQYANPWSQHFPNGENVKYADCDGNGMVDTLDLVPINNNYGLTHNKTNTGGGNGPLLYLQFTRDSAQIGDTVDVRVMYGDSILPVDSLYGLAFTVNYDNALVDTNSLVMTFNNSWLGNRQNLMTLSKDFWTSGMVDAAETRYDQTFRSGMGEIANISIVLIDNIDGKTNLTAETLHMSISNVRVIRLDGSEIETSLGSDSMVVYEPLITRQAQPAKDQLTVYPNPASNILNVQTAAQTQTLVLTDLMGKIIWIKAQPASNERIDLSSVAPGIYFVRASGPKGGITQKILIQ